MTAIKAIRGKIPPKLMTVLRFTVLKFLPLLFLVLALMRSTLMSSGASKAVVPFESATLIVLVFSAFMMPEALANLPDFIRIGLIFGTAAIPGIPTVLGGLLWPKARILGAILIPLSYLVDLIIAASLGGPIAVLSDVLMLLLSIFVLILDWDRKKSEHRA